VTTDEERLIKLEDRLLDGKITEDTYKEMKDRILQRISTSSNPSVSQPGQSSDPQVISGSLVVTMPGQDTQAESGIILSNGERLLNRFTIKKSLGRGGFGAVYLAEDSERKHDIALKVVTTNIGQAEMAATQMRNELTLRDKINDFTHIIRTYDIHTVEAYKGLSLILMPMEYAEGNSFRNFLAANKRDDEKRIKEGVDLFKQACKGVKAIHDAGLVHCDLKPENILICKDHKGQIVTKVSDFGISRNVDQWSMNQAAVIQSSLGTPYYMSPEQVKTARQKDIDGRADIYALGVILFEILDGDPPFDGTADEVRKKHLEMNPPKLKGIDEEYVRTVHTCLEKDPEKRYKDIEVLLGAKDVSAKLTKDVSNKNVEEKIEIGKTYSGKVVKIKINPDKIDLVIGPGGKNIKRIQEESSSRVEIEEDGTIVISAATFESVELAKTYIRGLTDDAEVGKIYNGKIVSVKEYGVFVEIMPGKEGLVHISDLSNDYIEKVEDVVKMGDEVKVKLIGIDDQKRLKLSRKAAFQ
jgi:serine/threonine protein kinase